jgi:hypothetical protein
MTQLHRSNPTGEHSSSTTWWNNVPRGTMDEVSFVGPLEPAVRLARPTNRLFHLAFETHDGRARCRVRREARARERHRYCSGGQSEVLDPDRPIREEKRTSRSTLGSTSCMLDQKSSGNSFCRSNVDRFPMSVP